MQVIREKLNFVVEERTQLHENERVIIFAFILAIVGCFEVFDGAIVIEVPCVNEHRFSTWLQIISVENVSSRLNNCSLVVVRAKNTPNCQ